MSILHSLAKQAAMWDKADIPNPVAAARKLGTHIGDNLTGKANHNIGAEVINYHRNMGQAMGKSLAEATGLAALGRHINKNKKKGRYNAKPQFKTQAHSDDLSKQATELTREDAYIMCPQLALYDGIKAAREKVVNAFRPKKRKDIRLNAKPQFPTQPYPKWNLPKQASALSDTTANWLGGALVGSIPGVNIPAGAANTAGSIYGYVNGPDADVAEFNEKPYLSWVPGVGSARLVQRRIQQAKKNGSNSPRLAAASEQFGTLASIALASLAGAGIGAGVGGYTGKKPLFGRREFDGKRALAGAGVGALSGAAAGGLSLLGSMALAALKRTRTVEEQREYDRNTRKQVLMNTLVPGVAAYNGWKSLGRQIADEREAAVNEEAPR